MTRELVIKHNHRMRGCFDFADDQGTNYPNHKLWGRTTTFPDWYYGLTREIDGYTWWILWYCEINTRDPPQEYMRQFDEHNNEITHPPDNYIHCLVWPYLDDDSGLCNKDQRAIFFLTREEASIGYMGQKMYDYSVEHPKTPGPVGMGVREDSLAWDAYYGNIKGGMNVQMQNSTVKAWDNKIDHYLYVTLPEQKAQAERIRQKRLEAEKQILPLSKVNVPKLKLSRGADNTNVAHAKLLNTLVHNFNAMNLRVDAIVDDLEAKTGEYALEKPRVWVEPDTLANSGTVDVMINSGEIPIRAFDIRIEYPNGFEVTNIQDHHLLPGALAINKAEQGTIYMAQATTNGNAPVKLDGKLYTLTIGNIGAISGTYIFPMATVQFIEKNGNLVTQPIEKNGFKVEV